MKQLNKIVCGILFAMLLVGCDSRIDAVNQEMANIRNQQPLPIEPAPVFNPVPSFNYSAQQLRSPFLPNSLANELKIMSGKRVYPNFSRQPQPLESYPLESLTLKGSMAALPMERQSKLRALPSAPTRVLTTHRLGCPASGIRRSQVPSLCRTHIS